MQDVTYQDYPIQYPSAISSRIEEIDKNEILDSLSFIWIRKLLKEHFFYYFYQSLLPSLEIDLSSVYPRFEIKSETSSIEGDVLLRISNIVDKLIEDSEVFKKVDKTKLMEFFSSMIEKSLPGQLTSITDDELTQRIEKIIAIEALAGMLNDLSPAQMEAFDKAVKRREFFK
ncbi:MAG: hypothetical protein ACE5J9_03740 [Methanosarcinales archaeon]